ncbi:hypothetical protein EU245_06535 [Lentibacillus lipolyticus]|nr:hypothetical protein EU245_06535 [Lentibacillus lipolyticus]
MGLFINKYDHPNVYKNDGEILEPNQDYYHKDTFSDMIQEQKKINKALSDAFHELKTAHQQQNRLATSKWQEIATQLKAIQDREQGQETFERQAMEWLQTLDQNNQKLAEMMQQDDAQSQEAAAQMESLKQSNQLIAERLEGYEAFNQELSQQLKDLAELNEQMNDRLSEQDNTQANVLERLESQEALMEKVNRQISHFRSILFERSSYLAEKIEKNYNLTSSYFYKLMKGSDQPLTLYMDQKKVENENRD